MSTLGDNFCIYIFTLRCSAWPNFPVNTEVISFVNQVVTLSTGPFGSDSTTPGCLPKGISQPQVLLTKTQGPVTYAIIKVSPEPMVRDTFLGIQSNMSTLISAFVANLTTGVCFWSYITKLEHEVFLELRCEPHVM